MPLFYYSVEFLAHHVTVAWIRGENTASRNKINVLKNRQKTLCFGFAAFVATTELDT